MKKVARTDIETRFVRVEKKVAKTESMGDTDIAVRITKAKERDGGREQETQGMDMTTGIMRSMKVTNSTGSTVSRAGMRVVQRSRAAQLYDRRFMAWSHT